MSTSVDSKTPFEKGKKAGMSSLSKFYLLSYNGIQTLGWGYILFQTIRHLIKENSAAGLWNSYGPFLLAFQSLAALEVLHSATGLVPSNPFITLIQVFSRVFQAWGIMYSVPEIHNKFTVPLVFLAWSITEVIRYSFYSSSLLGKPSSALTWCRYSFFYALYPTGVIGEVGNTLFALETIKRRQLYSFALPNAANVSFNYFYLNICLLLTYIPLFPQLFNHMRKQRAKVLGDVPKEFVTKKIK